ncbi:MAG: GGDEF domain-containing protein [Deltaproteobacteria bacterium]|nr:GGDEF domain-containing protein [Deltaproteobacteria bacterium]
MLLKLIIKHGRVKSVLFITFSAVVASAIATASIFYFSGHRMPVINMYLTIIIPAVIASLASWRTVGMILKIHGLEQEVRKLADYDSLTSVMSRAAFLNMSEAVYQLMARNQSSLAFLYIDIDDFKKINDTYTHAGGDAVLKSFGSILLKQIRKSDIAGRLGGEEFALLLVNTDSDGAGYFAEKIRNSIENTITSYQGKNIQYTVSIGVSVFDQNNRVPLDKLITQADTALYSAKNSGKNCVINWTIR